MLTEFSGNLAQHLDFGHVLVIVAKTIDSATRFHLTLSTAKLRSRPTANIGLQFSAYFRQRKCIVLNSRMDGEWGEEEVFAFPGTNPTSPSPSSSSTSSFTNNSNSTSPPSPTESTQENSLTVDRNSSEPQPTNHQLNSNCLLSGDFFMIYLLIGVDRFHIAINNHHFGTFKYRFPVQELRALELREQIQVIKQIDHRSIYPTPWPLIQASDYYKCFSNDIPILFRVGHLIVLTAHCFNNKKGQFIIKFMESHSKREQLHFNVRYDQRVVVRNSMLKNFEFGIEERYGGFPFAFNQQFKLAIAFDEREFLIGLNGHHFCNFPYRDPDLLKSLAGFKITCLNGLRMHVTGVDHLQLTNTVISTNYFKFSRLDFECA